MNTAEINTFLGVPRIATLVTLNANGSPNAVPVWYDWDGHVLWMFTQERTAKVRRIRNDNRACVSIYAGVGEPETWVTFEGVIEVVPEGGMEMACRRANDYYEPEKANQTIAVWSELKDWVLLKLEPTTVRSSD